MTDRLLELAEKAGVATRRTLGLAEDCGNPSCTDCYVARPRLDIAHDLLATLPEGAYRLEWADGDKWRFDEEPPTLESYCGYGTFEECVVALAERAMK